MKKLNFLGIGPKIAVVGFSWLAVAIYISLKFKPSFSFTEEGSRVLFYFGLALVITGALFYFLTVPALLKGLKETKLVTTGTFGLCRNPLYAAIILMVIPGVSFMMNS